MDELKAAKFDTATLVFSRINGGKMIARGGPIKRQEDGQATALEGQVFELRREDGSIVLVVRDKQAPAAPFTREQLRGAIRGIEAGEDMGSMSTTALVNAIADRLGLPK